MKQAQNSKHNNPGAWGTRDVDPHFVAGPESWLDQAKNHVSWEVWPSDGGRRQFRTSVHGWDPSCPMALRQNAKLAESVVSTDILGEVEDQRRVACVLK